MGSSRNPVSTFRSVTSISVSGMRAASFKAMGSPIPAHLERNAEFRDESEASRDVILSLCRPTPRHVCACPRAIGHIAPFPARRPPIGSVSARIRSRLRVRPPCTEPGAGLISGQVQPDRLIFRPGRLGLLPEALSALPRARHIAERPHR